MEWCSGGGGGGGGAVLSVVNVCQTEYHVNVMFTLPVLPVVLP